MMEEVTSYLMHGAHKCPRRFCWGNIEKIWQFRELIKCKSNEMEQGLVYTFTFTSFRCVN